ncbi:hypothetical protein [Mesobacillus subterraneus]|uniref:Uncharacterized protein n=1 Tax=Mesobacillus subterraneus TaxID=285983 RepID=A0A3R9E686_9BACI|nr:hypothetical protein [Mesobacillus subterraneus]RSD27072.1 hypothetical protein EJA10_11045 [Mesobacillus subterraneus]
MKSLKSWGVMTLIAILMGAVFWWAIAEWKNRNDPLNQSDAFVYTDNGMLYWFDLKTRNGQVQGSYHLQKLMEETGEVPFIEEKKYPLTGERTEKGYKFKVKVEGQVITFNAWFSVPHLTVQKNGEAGSALYNPVNQQELREYVDALLNYHAEEKENNRLKTFFSELRQVYGYLHTSKDGSYELFIKIDEALLQGELTGTLLMRTNTGEETVYELNGITDGHMLKLHTIKDGKEVKMTGSFHEGAQSFDLTFWKTNEKLTFHAVTD